MPLVTSFNFSITDKKVDLALVALTSHSVGDSKRSNTITIYCPVPPSSPGIYAKDLRTLPLGCIALGWKAPGRHISTEQLPSSYRVFVNGKLHGVLPFTRVIEEYSYTIGDCRLGAT